MIEIISSKDYSPTSYSAETEGSAATIVREIINTVRREGDSALYSYTERFDKVKLSSLEVSEEELSEAYNRVDKDFLEVLKRARDNIEFFHKEQLKKDYELKKEDGIILGQRYTPLERVGIYVPGGTAAYPSTVLMDAVPAKIAGVKEIIMATPPSRDGRIADNILAAAKLAGVTRVFKVGGAQAIAALAYGTESVPKVYKIVGPGNVFVAMAKKQVFGDVGIDMVAGPSEILIIADGDNNPDFLAADLLSQAEHDKLARAILITDDIKLAKEVQNAVEIRLARLKRREIAEVSIKENGKIILVKDIDEAIALSNLIAPEHLELCVAEPKKRLEEVQNAGSVFLGRFTPEALGDYYAGTNHTLPTNGTAKFSSPLSVDEFIKKTTYIYYTEEALRRASDSVTLFAETEGLEAHSLSVKARFEGNE